MFEDSVRVIEFHTGLDRSTWTTDGTKFASEEARFRAMTAKIRQVLDVCDIPYSIAWLSDTAGEPSVELVICDTRLAATAPGASLHIEIYYDEMGGSYHVRFDADYLPFDAGDECAWGPAGYVEEYAMAHLPVHLVWWERQRAKAYCQRTEAETLLGAAEDVVAMQAALRTTRSFKQIRARVKQMIHKYGEFAETMPAYAHAATGITIAMGSGFIVDGKQLWAEPRTSPCWLQFLLGVHAFDRDYTAAATRAKEKASFRYRHAWTPERIGRLRGRL